MASTGSSSGSCAMISRKRWRAYCVAWRDGQRARMEEELMRLSAQTADMTCPEGLRHRHEVGDVSTRSLRASARAGRRQGGEDGQVDEQVLGLAGVRGADAREARGADGPPR